MDQRTLRPKVRKLAGKLIYTFSKYLSDVCCEPGITLHSVLMELIFNAVKLERGISDVKEGNSRRFGEKEDNIIVHKGRKGMAKKSGVTGMFLHRQVGDVSVVHQGGV